MEGMIIIGTGGFAVELAGLIRGKDQKVAGFIGPKPIRSMPEKWLGDDDIIETLSKDSKVIIAVGKPEIREKLAELIKKQNIQQQSFTHPSSYVSPEAKLGSGSIIYPNVTIHSGVNLQQNVLINSNVTVGHETEIGKFTNIGPGASLGGCCKIGNQVFVGIGASTVENITINNKVIIGAGAAVVSDVKEIGTYVGIPAKKIV